MVSYRIVRLTGILPGYTDVGMHGQRGVQVGQVTAEQGRAVQCNTQRENRQYEVEEILAAGALVDCTIKLSKSIYLTALEVRVVRKWLGM